MDGRAGDFDRFVAASTPQLLRTAYLLTGDHHGAQDLVQAALMRTWRRWNHLGENDSAYAYVRRVMVNQHCTWWRRRWRGERPTAVLPDAPHRSSDDVRTVDDRAQLVSLLTGLSPRARTMVVLRHYHGLSDAEVADLLGCSPGTVKSTVSRALATVRASADAPTRPSTTDAAVCGGADR